ncbi:hypothetical protein TNCV_541821 [Trichonephila clavipes]|nr:hypothetical protein TNCV_541821 [Trichonephila clavipes]
MNSYSNEELINTLIVYRDEGCNEHATSRLYQERYPTGEFHITRPSSAQRRSMTPGTPVAEVDNPLFPPHKYKSPIFDLFKIHPSNMWGLLVESEANAWLD